MVLLVAVGLLPHAAYAFAIVYGIANGLLTIAKATLPVEMFGFANVGTVLGGFSAPSLITRALAPFGFVLALGVVGTRGALMGLVLVSLAACVVYVATTRGDAAPAHAPTL